MRAFGPRTGLSPLVPKLQLRHAPVGEAPLRSAHIADLRVVSIATPAKQSFRDNGVTKLELGNEENAVPISLASPEEVW